MDPWLVLLGACLAVEVTSFGQFMISRPLPTAVLVGAILGDPATGLIVGGVLELFHLPRLPLGGAKVPEGGPSALAATVAAVSAPGLNGLLLAVPLGLLLSELGGATWGVRRQLNAYLVPLGSDTGILRERVASAQWMGLIFDAGRGAVLTVLGLLVAGWLAPLAVSRAPVSAGAVVIGLGLVAALPLGAALRNFGVGASARALLPLGVALGVALGLWR